jgi:hypothetical protein
MVMSKIFHFGKTSLYIGPMLLLYPFGKDMNKYIPNPFYFDGGSYFKIGFYFLHHIFEFSRSKKDNTVYKEITKEELDKILNELTLTID